jgi:hypothetical protein
MFVTCWIAPPSPNTSTPSVTISCSSFIVNLEHFVVGYSKFAIKLRTHYTVAVLTFLHEWFHTLSVYGELFISTNCGTRV